jgi:hypothetical protein
MAKPVANHSILYVSDSNIYQIGPFPSHSEAMTAGKNANGVEFDINDTHVYMLFPNNKLVELGMNAFEDEGETFDAFMGRKGFKYGKKDDPRGAEYGFFKVLFVDDKISVEKRNDEGDVEYTMAFDEKSFRNWANDCA